MLKNLTYNDTVMADISLIESEDGGKIFKINENVIDSFNTAELTHELATFAGFAGYPIEGNVEDKIVMDLSGVERVENFQYPCRLFLTLNRINGYQVHGNPSTIVGANEAVRNYFKTHYIDEIFAFKEAI